MVPLVAPTRLQWWHVPGILDGLECALLCWVAQQLAWASTLLWLPRLAGFSGFAASRLLPLTHTGSFPNRPTWCRWPGALAALTAGHAGLE